MLAGAGAAAVVAAGLPAAGAAAPRPRAGGLTFALGSHAGDACPGVRGVRLTGYPNGTVLLRFAAMALRAGGRAGGTVERACVAQIRVGVPAGHRWRLEAVGAKGRAALPAGAVGRVHVEAGEVDDVLGTVRVADLAGPYRGPWIGAYPPEKVDQSRCVDPEPLAVRLSGYVTVADPRRDRAALTMPARARSDFAVLLGLSARPCA
ncbi:hypothetical protein [Pilimelia anulata]|uniref:hypothetical protein n=1 Tax=Pilimelia anulata TaxID=53371 RepID=UPI00166BAECA|nr:hypothetical protein [Pilimelia anulata]